MSPRDEALTRTQAVQEQASNPADSAWVAANAGSGKTTVLVRRVIRLLLAGTPPGRILCLTFTKAAAANMANRVLHTLSEWVRLDDAALDAEIKTISPLALTPTLRARARRLFAAALETPGGLKVQTIHAFCDRVLHQFPFEAGVPAGFEVLDEVQEADLLQRARQAVLIEAAAYPDSALGQALAHAVAVAADKTLEEALTEAVRERRKLARLAEHGEKPGIAALALQPEETIEAVEREIIHGAHLPRSEWRSAAAALADLGGNATTTGERLAKAAAANDPASVVEGYFDVFFTDKGMPRNDGGFGSAGARKQAPDLFARLAAERDRLVPLRDKHLAARARARTAALLTLATATIERFEAAKRARGALDYADLIDKTAAMFEAVGSAWVLYKLDGGIDHVLIDEAQDTSPEQWQVITKLTEEFFAGRGAREDRRRTVFAVGDDKQSIFGFQGADPRQFEAMRNHFRSSAKHADREFHDLRLDLSFRSAPRVLEAIDAVFARPEAFRGLSSGEEQHTIHEAIRSQAPALVEVWPTEKPEEDEDDGLAWDAPLDARSESSAPVRLAQKIATAVRFWLAGGIAIDDNGQRRAPRAGDVIVLVRQRGVLFEAILQALKRADVPVAGADRLKLTEHIAVMDLLALGDALTLEADDLALACVLKSPLFGLSEDDLFTLAHGRKGSLAAALAEKARSESRFEDAARKLAHWRKEAGELRPFDFFSRVLGRDQGRERMLARLGPESADALDEFLAHALVYEQTETPSLPGLLAFLRRAETEVKRDLEVESDAVRVMTVHGAKGLEAPIVVLADTTSMPDGRHDAKLLPMSIPNTPPGLPEALVWALRKDLDSQRMQDARAAARALREAEYRRLLYVALTRAADAVVVCGHESKQRAELPDGCWYRLVHDALEPEFVEGDAPGFAGRVWRWRPEPTKPVAPISERRERPFELPPWFTTPAPPSAPAPLRIAPSDQPHAATPRGKLAAGARLAALRRGDLLHRLLQFLPEQPSSMRSEAAERFLASAASDLAAELRVALGAEALAVVGHPDMAALFGTQSRAEVEFAARLPGPPETEVSGRIDRLVVTPDMVLIADFKTDATPPARLADAPGAYLDQLAHYRAAIQRIFPGRAVRAWLVFTAGPTVFEIA